MESNKKPDAIRPDHYGGEANPFEPRKVIKAWGVGFNLGNTLKYIARAGKKDPNKHIEDLKKARQYIDFEIADLEKELQNQSERV